MILSTVSIVALLVMVAGVAVAWSRKLPAVGTLAVANTLVFALQVIAPEGRLIDRELGLQTGLLHAYEPMAFLQLFTSGFVHQDLLHLFGNMLILLVLGFPFEERVGHRVVVGIYLATAALAATTQAATTWGQDYELKGASGAVFGIIGAFAAAYPNVITPMPLPLLVIMIFVRMRVWIAAVILGFAEYVYLTLFFTGPVAHAAHLGGLVTGLLFGFAIRKAAPARKPQPVDLSLLEPFAPDAATRDALQRMDANADEPAVFQAWLDRFFRTARCPTCQHHVAPRHQGEVVCTQGHRFDVRARRGGPAPADAAR